MLLLGVGFANHLWENGDPYDGSLFTDAKDWLTGLAWRKMHNNNILRMFCVRVCSYAHPLPTEQQKQ